MERSYQNIVVHGQLQDNFFFKCQSFCKIFNLFVENSKNLDCKNLVSNLNLVQINTLVVNTMTIRTIREF